MTLAHGTGAQQYDELIVAGALLIVLVLAVLHVRWKAHQRAAVDTNADRVPPTETGPPD